MKKAEAKRLAEAMKTVQVVEDEVPEDWHTVAEIADATGYSRSHTQRLILDGVKQGKWEMKKFRRLTSRGSYSTPHYRPTEP